MVSIDHFHFRGIKRRLVEIELHRQVRCYVGAAGDWVNSRAETHEHHLGSGIDLNKAISYGKEKRLLSINIWFQKTLEGNEKGRISDDSRARTSPV